MFPPIDAQSDFELAVNWSPPRLEWSDRHRSRWLAARAWLVRSFAGGRDACEFWSPWSGWSRPSLEASLHAALALCAAPVADICAETCARLVSTQRADGSWSAMAAGSAPDPLITALAVELLCARHTSMPQAQSFDAALRGAGWLATEVVTPAGLHALSRVSALSPEGSFRADLLRGLSALEAQFEAQTVEPLHRTESVVASLAAWHTVGRQLEIDVRKHPAVARATLLLIQKVEGSAGMLKSGYGEDSATGAAHSVAGTNVLAHSALALFAVSDPILAPRAAYAAGLAVEASSSALSTASWPPVAHGGVRAHHKWFAPRSVHATAFSVRALHAAIEHLGVPWELQAMPPLTVESRGDQPAARQA